MFFCFNAIIALNINVGMINKHYDNVREGIKLYIVSRGRQ